MGAGGIVGCDLKPCLYPFLWSAEPGRHQWTEHVPNGFAGDMIGPAAFSLGLDAFGSYAVAIRVSMMFCLACCWSRYCCLKMRFHPL